MTPIGQAPARAPKPPAYDPNLSLLLEAARRLDDNSQEFDRCGAFAAASRSRAEANELWQHARAVRFDGRPLSAQALRTARAVLGGGR